MKKLLKKPFILILSFIMVLSTLAPTFGIEVINDYGTHWANQTIQSSLDSGMAHGYPDGSFRPDNPITRGEFFALVNNAFNFTVASDKPFSDVEADAWYAPVVAIARAAGYINGYPDGGIYPEAKITRQEAAVILSALKSLTPVASTLTYSDASTVSSWSMNAVISMLEAEAMIGYPDGSFRPVNLMTRAETLVALNHFLSDPLIVHDPITDPVTDPVTDPITDPITDPNQIPEIISVKSMSADQKTMTLTNGGEAKAITATILPLNATNKLITWTSSNPTIAKVVGGLVTPMSIGTAIITGTSVADGTLMTSTTVTVDKAPEIIVIPPVGNPVDLGMAGDYVILTKTGISSVPNSVITGNIGTSPIDSTGITGFSLTMDGSNQFAISSQITGKAFAADYTIPTSSNLTTAISNMETAYTDAAGRAADYTELYSGDLSGKTLTPGVYKWGTGLIINSNLTLNGGPSDVFIFQVGEGITLGNGTNMILTGGVQAKNIFWQVAESVSIGTGSHFEGNILSMTNISLNTNASINGRLLAQTAVTLDQATVVKP